VKPKPEASAKPPAMSAAPKFPSFSQSFLFNKAPSSSVKAQAKPTKPTAAAKKTSPLPVKLKPEAPAKSKGPSFPWYSAQIGTKLSSKPFAGSSSTSAKKVALKPTPTRPRARIAAQKPTQISKPAKERLGFDLKAAKEKSKKKKQAPGAL
jgi:hypothetical protein